MRVQIDNGKRAKKTRLGTSGDPVVRGACRAANSGGTRESVSTERRLESGYTHRYTHYCSTLPRSRRGECRRSWRLPPRRSLIGDAKRSSDYKWLWAGRHARRRVGGVAEPADSGQANAKPRPRSNQITVPELRQL